MRRRSPGLARLAALATTLAYVLAPIAARRGRGDTSDRNGAEGRADRPSRLRKRCQRRESGHVPAPAPPTSLASRDPRFDHARVASDVLDVIEDACAAGTSQTEALELGAAHLARSGWRYADARGFVFLLYEDL
jgi:hypothetical protein